MKRYKRWWFLLPPWLFISACSSPSAVSEVEQKALVQAAAVSPRLQPDSRIRLTVSKKVSLVDDYQVDAKGYLTLPLVGTIKAAGLTPSEVEKELEKKFSTKYFENPKVTVSIIE